MQCQVYLNGMGEAQGEYLSIFYFLTPGPYDHLMQWPFQRRVLFTLLPRDTKENNPIRKTNITQPNVGTPPICYDMGWISLQNAEKFPECFERPDRDQNNEPYGQPEFVRLDQVESDTFLREDCLYFKVVCEDLSMKPDYLEFNRMGFLKEGEKHPLEKLPPIPQECLRQPRKFMNPLVQQETLAIAQG